VIRRLVLIAVAAPVLVGAGAAASQWQSAARLPVARSEVASAVLGGELVVVGGFLADGSSSARVEAYSPARDRWRRLPDLPVAVNHPMAAVVRGRLYVVGGYGAVQSAFVLRSGGWRTLPRLPQPRAAGGAAGLRGRLYVAGGVAANGLATRMLVFDPARRRWTDAPGPIPREHVGVTAVGGRLYVVGGRKAGVNFDFFQTYAPGQRRWTRLPPVPEARGGTAAAASAKFVVSAGGEAPAGTVRSVYAFDLRTRRWRRLPDLPTPRHGLALQVLRGRVYAAAGGPEPGLHVSDVNEFLTLP
jgi:non-specific serine/threonine protein kinase